MLVVLIVLLATLEFGLGSRIRPLEEIVEGFGYGLETHQVKTSDDYWLTIHRLLRGKVPADADHGVPVLLVIGVLQSSASNLAKGNGIAYSLADRGFDVWLSNYRGNLFCRQQATFPPEHRFFWNFTLHEMGTRDLPAIIDYVLETTHRRQLLYQGFSMGTTMFWILISELPEYQDKVAAMVAIAPVARPAHSLYFKNMLARKFLKLLLEQRMTENDFDFLSYKKNLASITDSICGRRLTGFACKAGFLALNMILQSNLDTETSFRLIPYSPSGISVRILLHYIQISEADQFQRYDYGWYDNLVHYDARHPPVYNLQGITLPVYFISSENDEMATPEDVAWLAARLPRPPIKKLDSVNTFRHTGFSLHKHLNSLFTQPLTQLYIELAHTHKTSLARVNTLDVSITG